MYVYIKNVLNICLATGIVVWYVIETKVSGKTDNYGAITTKRLDVLLVYTKKSNVRETINLEKPREEGQTIKNDKVVFVDETIAQSFSDFKRPREVKWLNCCPEQSVMIQWLFFNRVTISRNSKLMGH